MVQRRGGTASRAEDFHRPEHRQQLKNRNLPNGRTPYHPFFLQRRRTRQP